MLFILDFLAIDHYLTYIDPSADPCSPNPRQNGGTCSLGSSDYICSCPSDFTGQHCETNTQGDSQGN